MLVGLQSFVQEECPETVGSMRASAGKRRKLAADSREFNMRDETYRQLHNNEGKDKSHKVIGGSE